MFSTSLDKYAFHYKLKAWDLQRMIFLGHCLHPPPPKKKKKISDFLYFFKQLHFLW